MWAMLLGVDVGGTFTDAVLLDQDGRIHTAKAPTTPADQSAGVLEAVEEVLRRAGAAPRQVRRFAHGMTVATNALLEGKAATTALLATDGFTDVIELGRQARPQLYRLCAAPPAPLSPPQRRVGVRERTGPEGVIQPLTPQAAAEAIAALASREPEAIAVVLLHSYAHPEHELMLAQSIADALPGAHVSLSHDLVGTFREYERAATTEIDAALSPLLGRYLARLLQRAGEADLPAPQVMQSSGGLLSCDRAAGHAALTVLSGPAGGVGGARMLAAMASEPDLLCLDMGGTSCDICLICAGAVAETAQRTVAGRPLALPALDIHTVGAGGGSIAWRDAGGALRVGPRSAGADPGPACYGRGGSEPTVTDANLVLGRLLEDRPLAGGLRLDRIAAQDAVARLAAELQLGMIECAEGIVRIAEAEMLKALRVMSVERGHDPRGFALMGFGGAGPLHVVSLAAELGIQRVLCPRASGVLCALGLAAAAPRRDAARTVMLSGDALSAARLESARRELIATAAEALDEPAREIRVGAELRYQGQSFELGVQAPPGAGPQEIRAAFAKAHEQRYGYRDEQAQIELVTLRVSAFGAAPEVRLAPGAGEAPERQTREVILAGQPVQTSCLLGEMPPGTRIEGPALCALPQTTLLVSEGWRGEVDRQGTIVLTAAGGASR